MSERAIWKNGAVLPESEATVSIYDSAMMSGDAVFEMMRTFKGETFRLQRHLSRLGQSLELLRYRIPWTLDDLGNAHDALLRLHQHQFPEVNEWRTLIQVTRGPLGIYQHLPYGPTATITCYPLKWVVNPSRFKWSMGVAAHTIASSWGGPYAHAKHRSRLELDMAARRVNAEEAVLIDHRMRVTEAPGANVIAVMPDGELVTPVEGCLQGVTLDYVIGMADDLGMRVHRRHLSAAELCCAREVLFTCTPLCIYPARSINRAQIGGAQGPVYTALSEMFEQEVGVSYRTQELHG